jgi:stalled ribosome rescue protein Dom34
MHTTQTRLDELTQAIDTDLLLVAFGVAPTAWAIQAALARTVFITVTTISQHRKLFGPITTMQGKKWRGAEVLIFSESDAAYANITSKGGACAILRRPFDVAARARRSKIQRR